MFMLLLKSLQHSVPDCFLVSLREEEMLITVEAGRDSDLFKLIVWQI